jgi:hypothetical protein
VHHPHPLLLPLLSPLQHQLLLQLLLPQHPQLSCRPQQQQVNLGQMQARSPLRHHQLHHHHPLLPQALLPALLLLCPDHLQQLWNPPLWQKLPVQRQVPHTQHRQQPRLPVWSLLRAALVVQVD